MAASGACRRFTCLGIQVPILSEASVWKCRRETRQSGHAGSEREDRHEGDHAFQDDLRTGCGALRDRNTRPMLPACAPQTTDHNQQADESTDLASLALTCPEVP